MTGPEAGAEARLAQATVSGVGARASRRGRAARRAGKRRPAAARPGGKGRTRGKPRARGGRRKAGRLRSVRPLPAVPAVEVVPPQQEAMLWEEPPAAKESDYERGKYEGGEMLLERLTPIGMLLPDFTLEQVLSAGFDALRSHLVPLLDADAVYREMSDALDSGRPYACVRLGDGELLALSQDTVYDAQTISREAPFLSYAGVQVPDHAARDALAEAVRHAQAVGVPTSRRRHFQPLLFPALRSHGIDVRTLRMTESTINYTLYRSGLLSQLLRGRRILVIGNAAPGLAQKLAAHDYAVAGVIAPVSGHADVARVVAEASAVPFDIALVSAGVPAVVIGWRIAAELGKVALDFGHMADQIAGGRALMF